MTASTTRARNTRATGPARPSTTATARPGSAGGATARGYGAYVDGSSALQIGDVESQDVDFDERGPRSLHAGPVEFDTPAGFLPPNRRRSPAPVPRQRQSAGTRPEAGPATLPAPAVAPLPVALPRAPFLALIVGLVVAGVVGVLVLNTKINENAFELEHLRARQAALNLEEQQLAQRLADKESTGNLAAEAARLGLVPAGTPAFISIPDGRVIRFRSRRCSRPTTAAAEPGR
jgi:hypothetical protein